ncbi:MAG: 4Fe-4S dicluster domain-containing protein [Proteobacteria bacterium]|nr:4Fe-4S dicluster domain-containing protein [Pseudomonadota bacterium]
MKRKIITIDEERCTGCELCIANCPEGAIQIIDGKARLVSDLLCDGLGACLGHCPEDAITIEEREAEDYNERTVVENILKQGPNTLKAHLAHLREHQQDEYYNQAVEYLKEQNIPIPADTESTPHLTPMGGCPGSKTMAFAREDRAAKSLVGKRPSALTHWPIQMHLLSPVAPHYQNADMVLAADCVAYSLGDFHKDYLQGKVLGIACPKLDEGQEIYLEKLKALIDMAKINTLTIMIMQVPCCRGLLHLALEAAAQADRSIPIKCIITGLQGDILKEEWLQRPDTPTLDASMKTGSRKEAKPGPM